MVLIDDWVSIGSCNFDHWNLHFNLEANLEAHDPGLTRDVVASFEKDFALSAEITWKTGKPGPCGGASNSACGAGLTGWWLTCWISVIKGLSGADDGPALACCYARQFSERSTMALAISAMCSTENARSRLVP